MLKNYTSQIPVLRSVQGIEAKLIYHGANNILKEYGKDRQLSGICFDLSINGKTILFKLPARVQNCNNILYAQIRRPNSGTEKKVKEQAERTAWKILSDWVDIQMSMIELQQTEIMEVFLPYVYDPSSKTTFFEQLKEKKFKGLLGTGNVEKERG